MVVSKDEELISREFDIKELSKMYPLFLYYYNFYIQKYNKADLTVNETLFEIDMSSSSFFDKKKNGKGIPCYTQEGDKGTIFFPIVCVALFKSKDLIKTEY